MKKFEFTVSEDFAGKRVDAICALKNPSFSRTSWQKNGIFFVNGKEVSSHTKVKSGDICSVLFSPQNPEKMFEKWDFPLQILAESETWACIFKPSGISVHGSQTEKSHKTVVNALISHFGRNLSESPHGFFFRPGIVHRLDKETSGVLLISKTNGTLHYFQKNWSRVEKNYVALVSGLPPKKGRIVSGILRDPQDRKKMTVGEGEKTKHSVTLFERIKTNQRYSFLRVKILTGRTHQIRVHLSEIGFPILGDTKYGGEKHSRLLLHAETLCFPDPDQNNVLVSVSAQIPEEFFLFRL